MTSFSASNHGRRRQDDADEPAGLDDNELPLSPEEDLPVIPDDERVVELPS